MKCQTCSTLIPEETKVSMLGKDEYDKLIMSFIMGAIGTTIECPQCKEKIVFEKGGVDYNIKNDKNQKLSRESAEHYAFNRCRCVSCKIDFCVNCKESPYHIGYTCEEIYKIKISKKCKYCNTVITEKNKGPNEDTCLNPDCILIQRTACQKKLNCGHKCWGVKGEIKCPPCLISDCPGFEKIFDQDGDSYCNICFTEGLASSPVVLLSCKHYIHFKCIETRLKKKWVGPKITFNHCLCPQCNNWIDCPSCPELQSLIKENRLLYDNICKMMVERAKFEGISKVNNYPPNDSKSNWFNKEIEYLLKRLSYYMCYECKKPYFAGLRECGEGPNVDNNPNREYDPKDLICGAHANIAGVAGMSECKIHGKEFIEYKCKFCCNIASWFCWGTTHFCEDCHAKQCKGDYVSKYSKDKLPKCDPHKCPIKVKHPDNGEEYALGCSVCRNHGDNVKNF
jgi:E3 ubiquitin-protein ligase MYCBP2